METMYKKVIIKTEADLPKEKGDYFCNRSGFNTFQHLMTTLEKSYMREIRWYLLPIQEQPEMPTENEIQKKIFDIFFLPKKLRKEIKCEKQ